MRFQEVRRFYLDDGAQLVFWANERVQVGWRWQYDRQIPAYYHASELQTGMRVWSDGASRKIVSIKCDDWPVDKEFALDDMPKIRETETG